MQKTKAQHFLPRCFLKWFTNNHNQIYFYDKKNKKISDARNIKSVATIKHLYTIFDDDKKDMCVEKSFEKIETSIAPVLKKIAKTNLQNITNQELEQLIQFIVVLTYRTPETPSIAEKIINSKSAYTFAPPVPKSEKIKLVKELKSKPGTAYAIALQYLISPKYKELIHNCDVLLQTSDIPLIVNDRYMCLEKLAEDISTAEGELNLQNVKLHYPINKNNCITLLPKENTEKLRTKDIDITIKPLNNKKTYLINFLTAQQANNYFYASTPNQINSIAEQLKAGTTKNPSAV